MKVQLSSEQDITVILDSLQTTVNDVCAHVHTCLGHVQVLVLIFFSQTNRLARDRRTRDVFPQKTTWSCFPSLKVFSILSLSFVFHSQHSSITATGRSLHGAKHLEQERVSREPEPFSRE